MWEPGDFRGGRLASDDLLRKTAGCRSTAMSKYRPSLRPFAGCAQQHLSHCEKPSGRQSTLKITRQTSLAEALGSSSWGRGLGNRSRTWSRAGVPGSARALPTLLMLCGRFICQRIDFSRSAAWTYRYKKGKQKCSPFFITSKNLG